MTRRGTGEELRVPARELEALVVGRIGEALDDPLSLAASAGITLDPANLRHIREAAGKLGTMARNRPFMDALVTKVRVLSGSVEIVCSASEVARLFGVEPPTASVTLTLTSAARVTRTGRVVKLVDVGGAPLVAAPDTSLLRLVAKAHRWWGELRKGELDISSLSTREGVKPSYMTRVLRLAFLSPAVTDALLKGRQSASATVSELTLGCGVAASWAEQSRVLVATIG